ncbi:MAG: ADP-ribosylglycohydrolase family protein [Myxococcota bacterium]|nr:ADP-ribosylglycohydrolase family protein [Myxococcota bacterium]
MPAYVSAATTLTHTDPRAESGALAVALAAHHLARGVHGPELLSVVAEALEEPELRALIHQAADLALQPAPVPALIQALGLEAGVTGFVSHTVPVALTLAAIAPDFPSAIERAIALGGDTDTVAAIVGALCGARFGPDAIPPEWVAGIRDWPLSVPKLKALAAALAEGTPPPRISWFGSLLRNLGVFMPLVFGHLGRRALPPY